MLDIYDLQWIAPQVNDIYSIISYDDLRMLTRLTISSFNYIADNVLHTLNASRNWYERRKIAVHS